MLEAIRGFWNGSWCVAGDFNAILNSEECNRGRSLNSNMRRFSEVIEDLELKDLPVIGGPFTWNRGVNNQSFSRLDLPVCLTKTCVRPFSNSFG